MVRQRSRLSRNSSQDNADADVRCHAYQIPRSRKRGTVNCEYDDAEDNLDDDNDDGGKEDSIAAANSSDFRTPIALVTLPQQQAADATEHLMPRAGLMLMPQYHSNSASIPITAAEQINARIDQLSK